MELTPAGPGRTLSGRISGAVRSGVTVRLSGGPSGADSATTTDESGNYKFSDLPAGTYSLSPTFPKHSFHPGSRSAIVAEADLDGLDFGSVPALQVYGRDMGSFYQNVSVRVGAALVNDADVKVNGVALTYRDSGQDGYYYGTLSAQVPVGGKLVLEVKRGDATVTANGIVPEPPMLTSPPDGARFGASDDIRVTWTSSTPPDRFTVNAQWSCGAQCGTGRWYSAPGSARSLTIPARDLPAGQILLSVFAYSDGAFSGDYAAYAEYSGMNIRAEQSGVTIWR